MSRYFLFNKPYEVMSQFSEAGAKKTLADYCRRVPKDIYPAGRLDYDSEGLLLLTNDKAVTHRLIDPRYQHERTYWVQAEGIITEEAIEKLARGVAIRIDGREHCTRPARAKIFDEAPQIFARNPPIRFRKNVPDSWLSLTLTEGKNRQVRRMTAAVGFPTLRLIRYSIGAVTLDGIGVGECREVDKKIISALMAH